MYKLHGPSFHATMRAAMADPMGWARRSIGDRILERITRMCIAHVYARAGVSD